MSEFLNWVMAWILWDFALFVFAGFFYRESFDSLINDIDF